jgi:hypothetical protein
MVCLRVAEEFAPVQDARIKKGTIHGTPKFGAGSAGLLPLPDRRGKVISAPLDAVIRQGLCERTEQFHNTAEPILVALRAFWEPSFFSSSHSFSPGRSWNGPTFP